MSTQAKFARADVGPGNPIFSRTRSIIETAFYRNNVVDIPDLKTAYKLAAACPGTIVTDMPVYKGDSFGLDSDAKILLFNDGKVTGRTAVARRIAGEPGVDTDDLNKKLLEAVFDAGRKKMYHAQAYIGLDPEFMVHAHLLVPEGYENTIYNWLLNFQYMSYEYQSMYKNSKPIEGEGDIYLFADPDWSHPDHPMGLAYFDTDHNCAAVLGMRYFGEYKKGTLTMAWTIASRHGYACCHGGQKRYNLENGKKYVMAVFGLSGSGKSTITHNRHHDKYNVTILHDDAFIINIDNGSSIALEPTYFDKTADYPLECDATQYLLTLQNCGATVDEDGKVVVVTEEIRTNNGRAIKSKLWSPNRVDKIEEPINAIFWIMKDPTIPPIIKLKSSALGAAMGATLATKRSTAENLAKGVDINALVYEPYANPFRTYPLARDFERFKELIDKGGVDCYIINTGDFMGKKIKPADTLGVIEAVVDGTANFKPWEPFEDIEIMDWEGFVPDMSDSNYIKALRDSFNKRCEFVISREVEKEGFDKLPAIALEELKKEVKALDEFRHSERDFNTNIPEVHDNEPMKETDEDAISGH